MEEGTMSQTQSQPDDDKRVIPIVEEVLDVQKRQVETGGVRVRKTVHEREQQIDEHVWQEEVGVEHRVINRTVDGPAPTVRTEGDVLIVPVLEEVLVVTKQLMLREELRLTKRRTAAHTSRTVTLRREEAKIERLEPGNQPEHEKDLPPHHKDINTLIRKEPTNG
jgi:uncharacterized protein (TIGR02271 family)